MTKPIKDIGASVRQRLLNLARLQHEELQVVLVRYVIERFLYRLSRSEHSQRFTLKGAALFALWVPDKVFHRSTRDLDLRGEGQFRPQQLARIFAELCHLEVPDDGLTFDADSITEEPIRVDEDNQGFRLRIKAKLSGANIMLQVDVGLDLQVEPPAQLVSFPALLDHPAAEVIAYRAETVIAEKFHAMVDKDMANSRMKDFYDVRFLSKRFSFEEETLCRAIIATFRSRKSKLSAETPIALTPDFAKAKAIQWEAFLRKSKLPKEPFAPVVVEVERFLGPIWSSLSRRARPCRKWEPDGSWS